MAVANGDLAISACAPTPPCSADAARMPPDNMADMRALEVVDPAPRAASYLTSRCTARNSSVPARSSSSNSAISVLVTTTPACRIRSSPVCQLA